jgi:uncharacterized membrane protein YraQ (UPF0718 family)
MDAVLHALAEAGMMAWQITWSLILGFLIAAVIESLVRKAAIAAALPDNRPATLTRAALFGIASSSCSYAAVALARALFRRGANFTAAIAFQIASTNLVIELGLILALLLGWQFTAATYVGGLAMIVVIALLFRRLLSERAIAAARKQADRAVAGSMEGHAAMDMSVDSPESFTRRLFSPAGFTAVSDNFVMEWAAILRDLVIGLLIAGAAAAWIPDSFWEHLFFADHPALSALWGPLIGPLVAVATFVCSIGNVPLAAVLWNGGISFGGVVSFLFADLLIVPIIANYRRYYGARMAAVLALTLYVASVLAGYFVEVVFALTGLTPDGERNASVGDSVPSWNYTTYLNIVFGVAAVVLAVRFVTSGGRHMLSMMGGGPQ